MLNMGITRTQTYTYTSSGYTGKIKMTNIYLNKHSAVDDFPRDGDAFVLASCEPRLKAALFKALLRLNHWKISCFADPDEIMPRILIAFFCADDFASSGRRVPEGRVPVNC